MLRRGVALPSLLVVIAAVCIWIRSVMGDMTVQIGQTKRIVVSDAVYSLYCNICYRNITLHTYPLLTLIFCTTG